LIFAAALILNQNPFFEIGSSCQMGRGPSLCWTFLPKFQSFILPKHKQGSENPEPFLLTENVGRGGGI
jgi:hypothetical protein